MKNIHDFMLDLAVQQSVNYERDLLFGEDFDSSLFEEEYALKSFDFELANIMTPVWREIMKKAENLHPEDKAVILGIYAGRIARLSTF